MNPDESSDDEDYTDEMAMIQAVLADAERAEVRALDFKGHQVGRNHCSDLVSVYCHKLNPT